MLFLVFGVFHMKSLLCRYVGLIKGLLPGSLLSTLFLHPFGTLTLSNSHLPWGLFSTLLLHPPLTISHSHITGGLLSTLLLHPLDTLKIRSAAGLGGCRDTFRVLARWISHFTLHSQHTLQALFWLILCCPSSPLPQGRWLGRLQGVLPGDQPQLYTQCLFLGPLLPQVSQVAFIYLSRSAQ